MRARKKPILRLRVRAVVLPSPEFSRKSWIHGYRFSRGLCLTVAYNVQINGALHPNLQILKINISPLQGEKLTAPESRGRVEEYDYAKTAIEFGK
jgi:hypothetical protein